MQKNAKRISAGAIAMSTGRRQRTCF